MLEKLHDFATQDLAAGEREALGALLGPGIAWALGHRVDEAGGSAYLTWTPETLEEGLWQAVLRRDR